MNLPDRYIEHLQATKSARFIGNSTAYDYFDRKILRIEMQQVAGNRAPFYFYLVKDRDNDLKARAKWGEADIIEGPEALSADLSERLKKLNGRFNAQLRLKDEEISRLRSRVIDPVLKWFAIAMASIVMALCVFGVVSNPEMQTLDWRNPFLYLLGVGFICAIGFLLPNQVKSALTALKP